MISLELMLNVPSETNKVEPAFDSSMPKIATRQGFPAPVACVQCVKRKKMHRSKQGYSK